VSRKLSPKFAVTVIAPTAQLGGLAELDQLLVDRGITVLGQREMAVPRSLAQGRSARVLVLADVPEPAPLALQLDGLGETLGMDLVLQTQAVRQANYKLAVFDMDSTLIQCEVIDQLAIRAGVGAEVAEITERAMRGELDFKASFTERLGMLEGLSESALADVAANLPITEGMPELILTLRARGIRTAILSGGFNYFAQHLQDRFGFDEYHANALEIVDGQATGRVVSDIVDGDRKRHLLESIAADMGIDHSQVIAVGDGANDLPMLGVAGLGVAFEAKPIVREQAAHNIRQVGLDGVLYLLGSASELDC